LDASPTSVPIGTVHPLATFARARFHPGKLANSAHGRISPWRSCEHANAVSLTARRTVGSISVSRECSRVGAPSKRPHRAVQRALGFGRERGYRRDDLVDIFGLGYKYTSAKAASCAVRSDSLIHLSALIAVMRSTAAPGNVASALCASVNANGTAASATSASRGSFHRAWVQRDSHRPSPRGYGCVAALPPPVRGLLPFRGGDFRSKRLLSGP
jgi:hypothetical protein